MDTILALKAQKPSPEPKAGSLAQRDAPPPLWQPPQAAGRAGRILEGEGGWKGGSRHSEEKMQPWSQPSHVAGDTSADLAE